MQLFTPNENNFVCLQMHKRAYNQEQRALGFNDFFKSLDATISNYIWEGAKNTSFTSFLDNIIFENPVIDGIFITNDATSLVSKHFSKKNIVKLPHIIGFDLVDSNKEELLNGNIAALISQSPQIQGYKTIMELFRILFLKQEQPVAHNPIPINIILKENLQ